MKPDRRLNRQMLRRGWVAIPEAVRRTGIPRSSLYAAVRAERVTSMKIRSHVFVRVASVLKFGGLAAKERWDAVAPES